MGFKGFANIEANGYACGIVMGYCYGMIRGQTPNSYFEAAFSIYSC